MKTAAKDTCARRWIPSILAAVLLLTVPPAWGGESVPLQIIPGVGIGPARLGMAEPEARRLLAMAGLGESECAVDILAGRGRVIALGTRFGGCLTLPLPPSAVRFRLVDDAVFAEVSGIGGSAAPLVRAFGPPTRFVSAYPAHILLWPNGLVAQTAVARDDEVITYLAVIAPRTAIPPYPLLEKVSW